MSEFLKNLVDCGLLVKARDKEEIKKLFPHVLPKQKKGAQYKDSKREGRFSFYRITDDTERFNRVITNPKAVALIYNKLKKFGILQIFYEFMTLIIMYAIRESDVSFDQLLRIADVNIEVWKHIKHHIISLNEEELQDLAKEIVVCELENPMDYKCISILLVACRCMSQMFKDISHTARVI